MAYLVPSLQVSQEFEQIPVFNTSPLAALIIGPAYVLKSVVSVSVTAPGSGFTSTPTVTITGGAGTGAKAHAVLDGSEVDSIVIDCPGFGYTSVPTVTISGGGGTGATGTAVLASGSTRTLLKGITTIGSAGSVDEITAQLGDVDPANKLAYGVYCALQNSNTAVVYWGAVTTDDLNGYNSVLSLAAKGNVYYGVVPLVNDDDTHGITTQAAVIAHVNSMSAQTSMKWRVCWLSNTIAGVSDGDVADYLEKLTSSRRVRNVFPDSYSIDADTTVPGYFLACALAGLRSGAVPHQSLTNTEVIGPFELAKTLSSFSETQLDTMAGAGVWIVTQSTKGGTPFTRHQLTGDNTNLNFREDSVTANVDSISFGLASALAPFIGIYNISPAAVLKVRAAVDQELSYRLTNTYTERAGNQLLGYEIVKIAQDATIQDKINVVVKLQVPYPMNYIFVSLSI